MSNIREVAKKAGVGVATVSRAFSGKGYVAPETKKRILEVAEKLDYKPNEIARNLSSNRTGIIGIVVPDIENPFWGKFLKCVEVELYNQGFKALICNTIGISNREQDFIDFAKRKVVDGLIVGSHSLPNEAYIGLKSPVISFERDMGPGITQVCSNNAQGGRLAAEKLLKAGCKEVLQLGGTYNGHTPADQRHYEFKRIMEEAGVKVTTVGMSWDMVEYDYYRKTVENYMEVFDQVDGIFTADLGAYYALATAKKKGIKVPDQLKIIGFDGLEVTRMSDPVITTIVQDIPTLSRICVTCIVDLLNGKKVEPKYVVDVSLQEGGTV
ncbi:MAG: LacI family DNA-binding transcriptional regulator [Clostridiales bacterium]|nr:LacI family DNA-binding transcriptional regulator [Clostridiales bacterium]